MLLRVARWNPANGIAFVILVVVAALLTRDSPGGDTSEAEIASYYADPDNLDSERISYFLIGLAAFCFLLFLGSLRGALARAEGDPARLTTQRSRRRASSSHSRSQRTSSRPASASAKGSTASRSLSTRTWRG